MLFAHGEAESLAEAEMWWREAAYAEHLSAQFNLGVLLYQRGDAASVGEAEAWWRAAADAGHTGAQHTLEELAEHSPQERGAY
jgi:TPR repeat protein